jgi:hypothetical protein
VNLGRGEIGKLIAYGDAAQGGALAGDGLQANFVGGIGGEPEVLADDERIVVEREAAEVVAGSA